MLGGSTLGTPAALRAAAREVQLTLFDDPQRDEICRELAALPVDEMTPERALEQLAALVHRASRWKGM